VFISLKMTTNYSLDEYERTAGASFSNQGAVVKYISSRVVGHNLSQHLPGGWFCFPWASLSPNVVVPASTTTVGLALTGHTPNFTTISSIHSINGERFIDELRELSRLTEILGNVILQCCSLETHIRAQQLQIEWLLTHQGQNSSIIEMTFRTEIEGAKKLLQKKRGLKGPLEKQCEEIIATTEANEEQYQQVLMRRNTYGQELFDLERQVTQNNAEAQFLQRRVHHLDEESKFYVVKNQALQARQTRLRLELDQENFAQQVLRAELEVLTSEKITREDTHTSALDEAENSIDISQLPTLQPSKAYHEHLAQEMVRVRTEFDTKIQTYREELHRKFELDLHRYQIHKAYPVPSVTKEHEMKLEQYTKEKQDVTQQIAAVRGRIDEIRLQMESMDIQIHVEKNSDHSITNIEKSVATLHGIIGTRERQLEEALRNRTALKKQIDIYREKLNRYPKQLTQSYYSKRASVPDFTERTTSIDSSAKKAIEPPVRRDPNSNNGRRDAGFATQFPKMSADSTSAFTTPVKGSPFDRWDDPWVGLEYDALTIVGLVFLSRKKAHCRNTPISTSNKVG
jgi:DNA-binding FrmR family transcriptional regulator